MIKLIVDESAADDAQRVIDQTLQHEAGELAKLRARLALAPNAAEKRDLQAQIDQAQGRIGQLETQRQTAAQNSSRVKNSKNSGLANRNKAEQAEQHAEKAFESAAEGWLNLKPQQACPVTTG